MKQFDDGGSIEDAVDVKKLQKLQVACTNQYSKLIDQEMQTAENTEEAAQASFGVDATNSTSFALQS